MAQIEETNPSSDIQANRVDATDLSMQDFMLMNYVSRGQLLENEVRRMVDEVGTINGYIEGINQLNNKATQASLMSEESLKYKETSWVVNDKTVRLDNGYQINFNNDVDGVTHFTIQDAAGNQLVYKNQALIPVAANTQVDVLDTGIPVMNDMTFMLKDGTEISLLVDQPDNPFNSQDFSGGLATVNTVLITRRNQGMKIEGLNTGTPTINAPTVENVDTEPEVPEIKTETITYRSDESGLIREYDGSTDYNIITNDFAVLLRNKWSEIIAAKSEAEKEALLSKIKEKGSLKIWFQIGDRQGTDNYVDEDPYEIPVFAGDDLNSAFERAITRGAEIYKAYAKDYEGDIEIDFMLSKIYLPEYSFEREIPPGEATTHTVPSMSHSYRRDWYETGDYNAIKTSFNEFMDEFKLKHFNGLTQSEKQGLLEYFTNKGLTIDLVLQDRDGTFNLGANKYEKSYTFYPIPGETFDTFITRMATDGAHNAIANIRYVDSEGEIQIEYIKLELDVPEYTYKSYEEAPKPPPDPLEDSHSLDKNHVDGHILMENGGLNRWSYGGTDLSALSFVNPNDATQTVDGFFAQKLAFKDAGQDDQFITMPFLTEQEIKLLREELNISYVDASLRGELTVKEWEALVRDVTIARDNLNGTSQLQTIQLQRAMQTFTQNNEQLSNFQQRLYSLLRDMLSNMR